VNNLSSITAKQRHLLATKPHCSRSET